MRLFVLGGSLVAAALLCGCDSGYCDAAELRAALSSASSGDVVEVGACRIEGELSVPAGVTLRGVGPRSTLASAGPDAIVVELRSELDGAPTRLERVTVESRGHVGVALRGPGRVEITDARIDTYRGVGVGVDRATATLTDVEIQGEVTTATLRDPLWLNVLGYEPVGTCPTASCECEPGAIDEDGRRICSSEGRFMTWTSVFGLYARGSEVELDNVDIHGIAEHGMGADDSSITMTRGSIRTIVGVGVLARDCSLDLTDVTVAEVSRGLRGRPSYGLLISDASVITDRLEVSDNDDFGLVQLRGTAAHASLVVERNGNVGLWGGQVDAATIAGPSRIVDNGFAGVAFNNSTSVVMEGVAVESTHLLVMNTTLFGAQEIGDGILLSGTSGVSLTDITLRGNERVGLMVDLGGAVSDVRFSGVTVDSAGDAFGALAGTRDDGTGAVSIDAAAGWDDGIVRTGAAIENDVLPPGLLDFIVTDGPESAAGARGIVAPMY